MKNKLIFPMLKSRAILAPMSGVTDVAFRELCRKYTAGLTYTEFVNSTAIKRKNKKTESMVKTAKNEKPVAVQLFGSSVEDIIAAAKIMENKFDIVDINCGCPAYKVIKTGAGSELLKKPQFISMLVKKLSGAVKKPVTIKIRSGIDDKTINAVEIAKIAEKSGAAAITIHARTQKQGYSGKADWNLIKLVKESVNIPVIGNGDISSPEEFKKRLEETKVDYIMVGRAAIGNPYIFQQINDYLKTRNYSQKGRLIQFSEYFRLAKKHEISFNQIKAQAIYFTKGLKNSAKLCCELSKAKTIKQIILLMKPYKTNA